MTAEMFLRLMGVFFLLLGVIFGPPMILAAWREFVVGLRRCRAELKRLKDEP